MDQNTASRKVLRESQSDHFPYHIEFEGLDITVEKNVFSPRYFNGWRIFTESFPQVTGKRVLEVGCGTGITSLYLAKQRATHVLAVDISAPAVHNTQTNITSNNLSNIEARQSDIFSNLLPTESFDIIYWNMPFMYQPAGYKYRSLLERGLFDPGYALTERFLREASHHLLPGGKALVGTGNFGDVERFMDLAKKHGYTVRLISRQDSLEINPVDFQLYELTP
jgi:methylase of polypeptide subunit release factors